MGEYLERLKALFGINNTSNNSSKGVKVSPKPRLLYRGRPGEKVIFNEIGPKRIRNNNSPTAKESENLENLMRRKIVTKGSSSNPNFDIPFIPEKEIIVNGNAMSTNMLDSINKYVEIHNKNPKLAENPLRDKNGNVLGTPRKVSLQEIIGLVSQETNFGAQPFINTDGVKKERRTVLNSNYVKSFGYIPAEYFIRDFHYNDTKVNPKTPALLDAIRYYAEGDYNRGDKNHTPDAQKRGKEVWKNNGIQSWNRRRLETNGKKSK